MSEVTALARVLSLAFNSRTFVNGSISDFSSKTTPVTDPEFWAKEFIVANKAKLNCNSFFIF
jgi:hypothetical protein